MHLFNSLKIQKKIFYIQYQSIVWKFFKNKKNNDFREDLITDIETIKYDLN